MFELHKHEPSQFIYFLQIDTLQSLMTNGPMSSSSDLPTAFHNRIVLLHTFCYMDAIKEVTTFSCLSFGTIKF